MSEERGSRAKTFRFYDLAHELAQPTQVIARALGLGYVSGVRPISEADAEKVREDWAAIPGERINAVATAYHSEREHDRMISDHENRRERAPARLTAKDIEYRFDISPSTIRKWVQRGYLSPVGATGRTHIYDRSDVERVQGETASRSKSDTSERLRGAQPITVNPSISSISSGRSQSRVNPDQMLDSTEAAKLVGVTSSTIRVWVNRGHLHPAGRSGRKHLYRALDVLGAARSRQRIRPHY